MLRICQAAHTHTHAHKGMLLTSITPPLLLPAGRLDVSLHPRRVNIHSHCQDNVLSNIHAGPERVHMASQTNTRSSPQTGGQVRAHATPTEEVRLAFCCYCNSVIPRSPRPNGGQGAGFCRVYFVWPYPSTLYLTPPPPSSHSHRTPYVPPRLPSCHLKSTIVTDHF